MLARPLQTVGTTFHADGHAELAASFLAFESRFSNWRYAKEAILFACNAETDEEKQGLFDLARTWTQAALLERKSSNDHGSRPRTGVA
jgi:hypothetical protein